MTPGRHVIVAVAAVAAVGGCSSGSSDAELTNPEPVVTSIVEPSTSAEAPPNEPTADSQYQEPTEESMPMDRNENHRATVVSDAGSIDAAVVDGELSVDVVTNPGWVPEIDRPTGDTARIVWTSGERTVTVDLRGTGSGISQQVVSSG